MNLENAKLELKCTVNHQLGESLREINLCLKTDSPFRESLLDFKKKYEDLLSVDQTDPIEINRIKFELFQFLDNLQENNFEYNKLNSISFRNALFNLSLSQKIQSAEENKKGVKKILCIAANPKNTRTLRVYSEMRDIANIVKGKPKFEFIPVFAARLDELIESFNRYRPSIVHFSGHGNKDGIILLGDDDTGELVSSDILARFFGYYANTLECVILNSCYSVPQAEKIRQYTYVIGLKEQIKDTNARRFARLFYQGLSEHMDQEYPDYYFKAFNACKPGLIAYGFSDAEMPIFHY